MTALTRDRTTGLLAQAADDVRKNWGWFVFLGALQIVAGAVALSYAFSATVVSVTTLGFVLLFAAGAQTAAAILARSWRGFFLFLLLGILYAVSGFLMIQRPLFAAESLTLMLSAVLMVAGVYRAIAAMVYRFPSWGWVLLNGIVTTLLGVFILEQWPVSGLWVIGVYVGADLIMNGVTWSALAIGARRGVAALTGD
jgi:uncharacterized membrane protein HdeD (DUF308 family)